MDTSTYQSFIGLAIALGVGLLIGLQREQSATEASGRESLFLGGARTYPLIALCGALAMMVGRMVGLWLVAAVLLALLVPIAIAYFDNVRRDRDPRLTAPVTSVLTFLLGAMVMTDGLLEPAWHRELVVAGAGVVSAWLLSMKEPLHALVKRLSQEEVLATLRLLIVAVILLPLLPNRTYGPLDVLNPFQIGLMIVLIAGLGFAGYVAIRILGPGRGTGLTGLIGGMVSSTAVTLSFSGQAKREPATATSCAMAVVLASTVMCVRILVVVLVAFPPLLAELAGPMAAMIAAGVVASALISRQASLQRDDSSSALKLSNPFELGPAVKFGLLFAAILLASKAATLYLGSGGMYLAGVLAGTTDVDAITLSMANMARDGVSHREAATTILLGAGSNTLVKGALAVGLGGWPYGRIVVASFLAMILTGLVGIAAVWWA
jgi:uncharacterized membrane protein (DUF4010 family)